MPWSHASHIFESPPPDRRLGPVHHVHNTVTPKYPESLEAWEARAAELRRHILASAGLSPYPERCPLDAGVFGTRMGEGFTVSAVRFQTLPGFWACGNLFRPAGAGPFPAVLNPHGHWTAGRLERSERASVPSRGVAFARMGAVALTIDMVGYNDTDQVTHRFGNPSEKLWGFGPLSLQLWNLIRAVDFLESLDFVDPERIGCTGASGGGTQTFLLTAVDPRIRVAAPVNMISAHMHGGCACENAPMLRIDADNIEFGALAAPRPLFMMSATGDWTVNTPSIEYPAVRHIYDLYGKGDHVEWAQVDAPHNYNEESRRHVYRFFARRLLDKPEVDVAALEAPLPCAVDELRLYPAHPRPAHHVNQSDLFRQVKESHRRRFESLVGRTTPAPSSDSGNASLEGVRTELAGLLGWRSPADSDLRVRVVDDTRSGARFIRRMTVGTDSGGQAIPVRLEWAEELPVREVETGRTRRNWPTTNLPPTLFVAAGQDDGPAVGGISAASQTPVVCRVEPFLTGSYVSPISATGRNTGVTHFEDFNRTDAAWRVLDIALTSVWLSRVTGQPVHLRAHGDAGAWALTAMALTPEIGSADIDASGLEDREDVLIQRLYIPHLLRLGGVKALVHLSAPRPLTLRGAPESLADAWEAAFALNR